MLTKPIYLRPWWGTVQYNGVEYCVGTGILDITDPLNPKPFSDWANFDWESADIRDSAKESDEHFTFGGWLY